MMISPTPIRETIRARKLDAQNAMMIYVMMTTLRLYVLQRSKNKRAHTKTPRPPPPLEKKAATTTTTTARVLCFAGKVRSSKREEKGSIV
jgi:hypothetical protein